MSWRNLARWVVLAICLAPRTAMAGPLDDLRSEVGGGSSSGSSSDSSHDSSDDDDDDDDDSGSLAASISAAIVESITETSARLGRPGFARYPYEQRELAGGPDPTRGPYRGWVRRLGAGPATKVRGKSWSLRAAVEGAYLRNDSWRGAFDIEAAWWRLSLRSDASLYIDRNGPDGLWLGNTNAYFAFVMQPKVIWRLGMGAQYMIDATRVDDPRREDAVGFDASTTLDVFLVRPLVISARGDVGRLGGATTGTVRGTLGFMVRRFEGYGGYELRSVGRVRMHGPVLGVRVWF